MRTPPPTRARLAVTALAVAGLLAVAACSGAANQAASAIDQSKDAPGFDASTAGQPAVDAGGALPLPAASSGPAVEQGPAASTGPDAYIVRTGSISIEVPKIDPAMLAVRTAITGMGGYISDSDRSNSGDEDTASVTYRVPVDRWQDAVDAVEKIASKVDSAKSNAVEVTGQVLDLGARIDNLQATEHALQAIMSQATRITDILAVESQLSDVQGQIEQLTTQQAHLKDQAALATLSVLFALPPTEAVVQASRGWDPGAQLDQASAALLSLGQALASAGIWLVIVGIPVAILVLIVGGVAWLVVRRVRRDRPSRPLATPPLES